jgi:hypothetical protein
MGLFFSYDGIGDFQFHDNAEAARAHAVKALESEQETAGDEGWSEHATSICWGSVSQVATMTNERPVTCEDNPDFSIMCDCELKDTQA